ncbi:MAG: hypothetical protein J4N80_03665, partial [Chloroflexi bacterium]|nr:hypothetical protein [Chloroflexota bacterium]
IFGTRISIRPPEILIMQVPFFAGLTAQFSGNFVVSYTRPDVRELPVNRSILAWPGQSRTGRWTQIGESRIAARKLIGSIESSLPVRLPGKVGL